MTTSPPTSLIGYCDLIERRLDDARLAAQGQDEGRALAAIDDARLAMHQMRLLINDRPTGEFLRLKRPTESQTE